MSFWQEQMLFQTINHGLFEAKPFNRSMTKPYCNLDFCISVKVLLSGFSVFWNHDWTTTAVVVEHYEVIWCNHKFIQAINIEICQYYHNSYEIVFLAPEFVVSIYLIIIIYKKKKLQSHPQFNSVLITGNRKQLRLSAFGRLIFFKILKTQNKWWFFFCSAFEIGFYCSSASSNYVSCICIMLLLLLLSENYPTPKKCQMIRYCMTLSWWMIQRVTIYVEAILYAKHSL